ncbi:tyrosine-protein phosphatase [Halopseudomonas pachastrellae]|nr:tyrosine-protein phosphatase [Halopseudomonas pachastrellae]
MTDTDVIRVLREIRAGQQQGKVLIHCKHGQNRTGLMAAMYRIVFDGWSREQAMAEMLEGGFGRVDVAAGARRGGQRRMQHQYTGAVSVRALWQRADPVADQRVAMDAG